MKKIIIRVLAFMAIAAATIACVCNLTEIVFTNCKAGAEETIIVKTEFRNGTGCDNTYLVFAALFPSELKIAENATVTYTSKNFANHNLPDVVDAEMVLMEPTELEKFAQTAWPTAIMAKFGTMGNYGDFEWVVWRTAERCNLGENGDDAEALRSQADIKITFQNSPKSIKFNFAAMYATTTLGMDPDESWGVKYCKPVSKLYQSTGGAAVEDFTVPKLVTITPVKYTFEDVFCVNFLSQVEGVNTPLVNVTDVHLQGKVVLNDGTELAVDKIAADNRMTRASESEYRKYIYPRQFFNVPAGMNIKQVFFWFVSADGTKVENAGGSFYEQFESGTPLK